MPAAISHVEGSVTVAFGAPNTTLTAASAANATSLTVASGTAFAAGQLVLVGRGALAEIVKVKTTASTTLTLTDGGCANAHSSGDEVATVTVSGQGAMPRSPYLAGG